MLLTTGIRTYHDRMPMRKGRLVNSKLCSTRAKVSLGSNWSDHGIVEASAQSSIIGPLKLSAGQPRIANCDQVDDGPTNS